MYRTVRAAAEIIWKGQKQRASTFCSCPSPKPGLAEAVVAAQIAHDPGLTVHTSKVKVNSSGGNPVGGWCGVPSIARSQSAVGDSVVSWDGSSKQFVTSQSFMISRSQSQQTSPRQQSRHWTGLLSTFWRAPTESFSWTWKSGVGQGVGVGRRSPSSAHSDASVRRLCCAANNEVPVSCRCHFRAPLNA